MQAAARSGRAASRLLLALVLLLAALAPVSAQIPAPVPAQERGREITVGAFITSLNAIDPGDGSFRVSGYVWFRDPLGTFDLNRDFELISRSSDIRPFARMTLPGGASYTAGAFEAVVDHAYDMRDYPFDRQDLFLSLEAASGTGAMVFAADTRDSRIADFVRAPGWHVSEFNLVSTDSSYGSRFGHAQMPDTFSRLTFVISIDRNISPLLFEKFTGFFVAFIISACVVLVPVTDLGTRVSMTTGSIFAAVVNRYRMEDAIGFDAVFGTADQITLLTFGAILSMLFFSILLERMSSNGQEVQARRANSLFGLVFVATYVLIAAACFLRAIL